MKQKIKFAVVMIMSTVLSLLIIETGLRLLDIPKQPVSGWTDCKKPKECKSLGFRGEEINYSPDDFVIILLGDSKVAAWGVAFDQMPERRLEHNLKKYKNNVKVFTLGSHGYGQDQELLVLKEYFKKHRADLVLLFYSDITDIEDNMFPVSGRYNAVKPTFWLKNGELHGPTEGWLESIGPNAKLALLWEAYFGKTLGELRKEMWEKDILPLAYQPQRHYEGEVNYEWQQGWDKEPELSFREIDMENVTMAGQFTPRSQRRQYGIDLSRRLFSEIKKITEMKRAHFIIFKEDIPPELQDIEKETVYLLNGKYYKTSMKQYQLNLTDLFQGFEHYRIPLNMADYKVSPDDAHLNQKAINLLMEELSLIISKKEYFKH